MKKITKKFKKKTFRVYIDEAKQLVVAKCTPSIGSMDLMTFKGISKCQSPDIFDERFGVRLAILRCYQSINSFHKHRVINFIKSSKASLDETNSKINATRDEIKKAKLKNEESQRKLKGFRS